MLKIGKVEKEEVKAKCKALVFGFDHCGFTLTDKKETINGIEYHYSKYETHVDLSQYDYCVIPSGIFESIELRRSYIGNSNECKYDKERLLEFDRMVINFIRNKGKMIFLMSEITKEIPIDDYRSHKIHETDLAKKILLQFFSRSESPKDQPPLQHKRNEFQKFTEKYGVGKTRLNTGAELEFTPLIGTYDNENIFGVELLDKRLFFLPFHTTKKDFKSLIDLSLSTVESVMNYIQNHTVNIPEWVKSFSFQSEVSIKEKILELEKLMEAETEKQIAFDSYKSILCNQGDPLASEIVKILKNYFGLIVDDKDEKLDDFAILNDNHEVICSGEIKGVAGDCKRQYLSQLNANRDMKEYPSGLKGLLVINDGMKIKSVTDKGNTKIPNDCLLYAQKENINIIRTIDLLNLMQLTEDKDISERREFFHKIISGESGWIQCIGKNLQLHKPK